MPKTYFNYNHFPNFASLSRNSDEGNNNKFKPLLERQQFRQQVVQKTYRRKSEILTEQTKRIKDKQNRLFKAQVNHRQSLPTIILSLKQQHQQQKNQILRGGEQLKKKMQEALLKKHYLRQSQKVLKIKFPDQKQKPINQNSMIATLIQEQIDKHLSYMQEMQQNILHQIKKKRFRQMKQLKEFNYKVPKQNSKNKQKGLSTKILPQIKKIQPLEKKIEKIPIDTEKLLENSRKKQRQKQDEINSRRHLKDLQSSLYKQQDLNSGWQPDQNESKANLHQDIIMEKK